MSRDTDPKTLLPYLNELVKTALSSGASGAEFLHTTLVERRFQTCGAKPGPLEEKQLRNLHGLIFLENGSSASFSVNADLRGRHPASIQKAIERAKKSAGNPLAGPADRLDINEKGKGLRDPRYPSIDQDALQELVEINQQDGPQPHNISYTDRLLSRFFLSSKEVHAQSTSTFYKLEVQNEIRRWKMPLRELACGRAFSHVGSIPFGRALSGRMEALSESTNPPEGPVHLVLPTRVMAWILDALGPVFASDQARSKSRFLHALPDGFLGSKIVHVVDDPAACGGVRTRAFDDRGIPPIAVPIIREGQVGNYYLTPEEARKQDVRPTGHTWGGKTQASNLILRAGNRSRTQMLSEVPVALELDHLQGKLDLKTGLIDAYGPALVLDKGKPRGAVRSVSIQMPIAKLLSAVREIASNQMRFGAVDSATVLTDPVDIAIKA